jgi:hypothetical protein
MPSSFPFSQSVVDIIATGKFLTVYACQLDFEDGMVFAHTGTGTLVIDGITYDGVGHFGEVGQSQESDNSGSPMSVDLTLSGLDSYIITETNIRGCRGRSGKLMFVVFDEAGNYAADIRWQQHHRPDRRPHGGVEPNRHRTIHRREPPRPAPRRPVLLRNRPNV